MTTPDPTKLQTITLGGGCFWCTEAVYVRVRGVHDVESGYSNGHVEHPTPSRTSHKRSIVYKNHPNDIKI